MNVLRKIGVFGDSILKGIQLNPENKRYRVDNHIDTDMLSRKYSLEIKNCSKFGCTAKKGGAVLEKHLENGLICDAVIMDFGGNDCDFDWKAISEHPDTAHEPNVPLAVFVDTYREIIRKLKQKNILPILTTLPPLDPQRFFNWFFKGLNKENILKWLGSVNAIYRYQENYSRTVEKIARDEAVPLVDLRGAFLRHHRIEHFICDDGTHPNTAGQALITAAFSEFAQTMVLA